MLTRFGGALIVGGLLAGGAVAQTTAIQWKQVLNMPKGANLPAGVSADILGIAVGDSYQAAKKIAQALAAESKRVDGGASARPSAKSSGNVFLDAEAAVEGEKSRQSDKFIREGMGSAAVPEFREQRKVYYLPVSGGRIEASFVGQILVRRYLKVAGARPLSEETITIHLSAPSSGHQVVAVERVITNVEQADEVRIGEFAKALSEKFKSPPQILPGSSSTEYRWQFNDGQAFVSRSGSPVLLCGDSGARSYDSRQVKDINKSGECDVVLKVAFNHGISNDHAKSIRFLLTDNERLKANLTADYGFFESYVSELRGTVKGTAPKL